MECFSREDQSTVTSTSMNGDTTPPPPHPYPSHMPQQNRYTHIQNKDTTPAQTRSLILHSIMKRVCEPDRGSPWFCGSAQSPDQSRGCGAPWKRHTETRPGPRFRSCTTSRCSPSREGAGGGNGCGEERQGGERRQMQHECWDALAIYSRDDNTAGHKTQDTRHCQVCSDPKPTPI